MDGLLKQNGLFREKISLVFLFTLCQQKKEEKQRKRALLDDDDTNNEEWKIIKRFELLVEVTLFFLVYYGLSFRNSQVNIPGR